MAGAKVNESKVITDVCIVEPVVRTDDRGCFVETYRREWFPRGREMIQGNRADRQRGCVVGLHYHLHQADYWYVPFGQARVVLHDLRVGEMQRDDWESHWTDFSEASRVNPAGAYRLDLLLRLLRPFST
jgi:dTDP-4-dehydrorhamnose 3,5-epimerase-like enzyme